MIENGYKLVLKKETHVLEMRLNLISSSKLDEAAMTSLFGAGRWKLSWGNMIVTCGRKVGSLYIMHVIICKCDTNVSQEDNEELFHKRLGHMRGKGLEILAKNYLWSINGKPPKPYEDFKMGKQGKLSI